MSCQYDEGEGGGAQRTGGREGRGMLWILARAQVATRFVLVIDPECDDGANRACLTEAVVVELPEIAAR